MMRDDRRVDGQGKITDEKSRPDNCCNYTLRILHPSPMGLCCSPLAMNAAALAAVFQPLPFKIASPGLNQVRDLQNSICVIR